MRLLEKILGTASGSGDHADAGFSDELRQSAEAAVFAKTVRNSSYRKLVDKIKTINEETREAFSTSEVVQDAIAQRALKELNRNHPYRATSIVRDCFANEETKEKISRSLQLQKCLRNAVSSGEVYETRVLFETFKIEEETLKKDEIRFAAEKGILRAAAKDSCWRVFDFAEQLGTEGSVFSSEQFKKAAVKGIAALLTSGDHQEAVWFLNSWDKFDRPPFSKEDKTLLVKAAIQGLSKAEKDWSVSIFNYIPSSLKENQKLWEILDAKDSLRESPEAQKVRNKILEKILDRGRKDYELIHALDELEEAIPGGKNFPAPEALVIKIHDAPVHPHYLDIFLDKFPNRALIFPPDTLIAHTETAIASYLREGKFSEAISLGKRLNLEPKDIVKERGLENELEEGIQYALKGDYFDVEVHHLIGGLLPEELHDLLAAHCRRLIEKRNFDSLSNIRKPYPDLVGSLADEDSFRGAVREVIGAESAAYSADLIEKFYIPLAASSETGTTGIISEEHFGKPPFIGSDLERDAVAAVYRRAIFEHDRSGATRLARATYEGSNYSSDNNLLFYDHTQDHIDALKLALREGLDSRKFAFHTEALAGKRELLDREEKIELPVEEWLLSRLSASDEFTSEEITSYKLAREQLLLQKDALFLYEDEKQMNNSVLIKNWSAFTEKVRIAAREKLIRTLIKGDFPAAIEAARFFPFGEQEFERSDVQDAFYQSLIRNLESDYPKIEALLELAEFLSPTEEQEKELSKRYTEYAIRELEQHEQGDLSRTVKLYSVGKLPEATLQDGEFRSLARDAMISFIQRLTSDPKDSDAEYSRLERINQYVERASKSREFREIFGLRNEVLKNCFYWNTEEGNYRVVAKVLDIMIKLDEDEAKKFLSRSESHLVYAARESFEKAEFDLGENFFKLSKSFISGERVCYPTSPVDRSEIEHSIRQGLLHEIEVKKNPGRAKGLYADFRIPPELSDETDSNLFGFSSNIMTFAEQEGINSISDLLGIMSKDPVLTAHLTDSSRELKSTKDLRQKGEEKGLALGETELALQLGMNLEKLSDDDYLKIVKECSNIKETWQSEDELRLPFMEGANLFGASRMYRYLNPEQKENAPQRIISKHDALIAFSNIALLAQNSGLAADQFYNQILEQVRRSGATYAVGTAYHRLNEISQTLSVDIEGSLKTAANYPEVKLLAEVLEKFNTKEKVFESLKSLDRFAKLEQYIKQIEMLKLIKEFRDSGDVAAAVYIETLAFHPHSNVDLAAVEKFAVDIAGFLDLDDAHSRETHKAKKPSNLYQFNNLELTPEDLRKALVSGALDDLQIIRPMEARYKVTETGEVYSVRSELRRALGSRSEGVKGEARDVKGLFHKISNEIFKPLGVDVKAYIEERAELPKEHNEAILKLLYNGKFGVNEPVLRDVVVKIHPKSSPEAVLAGDDTACCMKFGSGKANVYTFNLGCAQLTVQVESGNEDSPMRTIAQSVLTRDIDIHKSIPTLVNELKGADKKLSEVLPQTVTEIEERYLAADNVEMNPNYITPEWSKALEIIYSDFLSAYMKKYGKDENYNTSIMPVGMGFSDAMSHLRTIENTFAPEAPVSYSDKLGERVYVVDLKARDDLLGVTYDENKQGRTEKKERAGVSTATFADTIPISYLESKIYSDNDTLIESLHKIENRFLAVAINNRLRGYPDLSLKYVADNKVLGYLVAHQGVFAGRYYGLPLEENEPVIYVADFAVHPDAVTAVPRMLSEFCDRYIEAYLEKGELLPMFAQLREKTSYKLLKQKVEWLEKKLGCKLEFIEGDRYSEAQDTMVPVIIRPQAH